MGESFFGYLWPKSDVASAFVEIVTRVAEATVDGPRLYTLHVDRWGGPRGPDDTVTDVGIEVVEATARTTVESRQEITVYFDYQLKRGDAIPITVHLRGSQFANGDWILDSGPIYLMVGTDKVLHHDRAQALVKGDRIKGDSSPWSYLTDAELEVARDDIQELLERAIGLYGDGEEAITHASVFYNDSWYSPLGAIMAYHVDIREFLNDFARMYVTHQLGWVGAGKAILRGRVVLHAFCGVAVPMTFGCGDAILDLLDTRPRNLDNVGWLSGRMNFHRVRSDEDVEILAFLKALDEEAVTSMQNLSDDKGREAMERAAAQIPGFRFEAYGKEGALAMAPVRHQLWRWYRKIAESAGIL